MIAIFITSAAPHQRCFSRTAPLSRENTTTHNTSNYEVNNCIKKQRVCSHLSNWPLKVQIMEINVCPVRYSVQKVTEDQNIMQEKNLG
jgi:hypothetical protein